MTVHETWCDGSAFKSLYARQRDIEARGSQLDEDKKLLQKMRPKVKRKPTQSQDVGGECTAKANECPRV